MSDWCLGRAVFLSTSLIVFPFRTVDCFTLYSSEYCSQRASICRGAEEEHGSLNCDDSSPLVSDISAVRRPEVSPFFDA